MIHDNFMPKEWHIIKSVLLTEMQTAANFHLCVECANALFHARLIGQKIAGTLGTELESGFINGNLAESTEALRGGEAGG